MTIAKRISELETEQTVAEITLARDIAAFRAREAELASSRAGVALHGELTALARTDAILNVLRAEDAALSPTDIVQRLNAAGRSDERRSVTATLDYRLKQKMIVRPDKDRYLAL